ncbi:low molecular weight phosphotyrosine protein phosphatase [Vibrio sp. RE86]|uniref:low molecular weight protein-tyrosine-phosphatase n=1 Tax=Vibrio sp. RE86 TaxID=2607605 RepID=UPI00149351C1|nr:low molecular weight protein-tyrosine-phosphatase [Vibrio sp. RE86]NOH79916.1 low molecular weight phosphotyrosine protein phosphatase [Vibrio sp. RE86]
MFNKILVVCVGNICRSPLGEALLADLLPNKQVASAGVMVDRSNLSGCAADINSQKIAQSAGFDISGHKAQQLTKELCDQYDLILVMESAHVDMVAELVPNARSRTLLFGQWSGDATIADPYQKDMSAFQLSYQRIHRAAHAWAKKLS